ncbi:MAG: hypothetical protein ACM3H9_06055 [Rhodospirillaceae bacterium]
MSGSPGAAAAEVVATARRVADAPAVLRAADLVFRVWPQALSCPESFEIDGVIHGTCSVDSGVNALFDYGVDSYWWMPTDATVQSGAANLQVHFGAAVYPEATVTQEAGYRCTVTAGTMNWAGGSWSWFSTGMVSHSQLEIQANGARWQSSASTISVAGPYAVVAQIDRASGVGTITQAGTVVAAIGVNDGCVTVDFVDPQKQDTNRCLW